MPKELTFKSRTTPRLAGSEQKSSNPPVASTANPQRKITVLLADDHTIVREGLRMILECSDDIEVVGEAENGRLAVQKVAELKPDVILMDLSMPNLNGVEATRQILKESPGTKVLILSTYSDDERLLQLLNEGIAGYLVKQTAAHELPKAIREAKKGNAFFSASISKKLLDQMHNRFMDGGSHQKKKHNTLTTREAEVLQLIAEGFPNKGIASELGISIKTVEKHRQQVMNKLNIHCVAGLTRHAISKGVVAPAANLNGEGLLQPVGSNSNLARSANP
jgi:DNA-binding NarL/FixJ family response regulator